MSDPRTPLAKLPAGAIGALTLPPLSSDVITAFGSLPDLTGMASDAMDELGIVGVVPASILRPTDPTARIVGRALTVHNVTAGASVPQAVAKGVSGLAEIEAHNLAEPGDVLVVQGVDGVSNLGGMTATIGHRQGEIGAIVDGGARDVDHSRRIGYPIWSRSVSPITGKWRVETVAVNKPVLICGIAVAPGDLVLADEVGVCFIPRDRVRDVLDRVRRIAANEEAREAKIAAGAPVADLLPRPKPNSA
jgi:4-hydroxy-4-methyl-2-oxoglutarate aldolase